MDVFIPKYEKLGEGFNDREQLKSFEHPGRRTTIKGYQSPAFWISDLSELKKVILLCSFCRINFNHKKHHYEILFVESLDNTSSGQTFSGACDACKEFVTDGTTYIHEEYQRQVSFLPGEMRRRNREASHRAWSTWEAVQRSQQTCLQEDICQETQESTKDIKSVQAFWRGGS